MNAVKILAKKEKKTKVSHEVSVQKKLKKEERSEIKFLGQVEDFTLFSFRGHPASVAVC